MLEVDSKLKAFLAVARFGSFSAAAKELGISQSAISQSVAELEKQCECKLFLRTGPVALTLEGERFKPYAEEITHLYDAAVKALNGGAVPAEIELSPGRHLQFWSVAGELHLKLKEP